MAVTKFHQDLHPQAPSDHASVISRINFARRTSLTKSVLDPATREAYQWRGENLYVASAFTTGTIVTPMPGCRPVIPAKLYFVP